MGANSQVPGESSDVAPLGIPAWIWSLAALLLGAATSLWTANGQYQRQESAHHAALGTMADNGRAAVLERLDACELLVRSVQTLFLASNDIDANEFGYIYANLRPSERFPSLQAIAYAQREQRPDGVHYLTTLIAPAAGNERLLGFDVVRQSGNFAAVLSSRDSDKAALSAPFRLVQQATDARLPDGITMRLPVFTAGLPPRSLQERRERMRGSLAVSFRVSELIGQALAAEVRNQLFLRMEDVTDEAPQVLFDSYPEGETASAYRSQRIISYGGRRWKMTLDPADPTMFAADWRESVLWPGLIASTLFALLVWSLFTSRRRAIEQGWHMSRRYRNSEERFRALNELLPALVLLARSSDGHISYANQASRLRLGEAVTELELPTLFEDAGMREQLRNASTIACNNVEAVLCSANGDRFWANVSIASVAVGGEGKLLMVASDISEQRQLTELLTYQASHDALTELYNRREFERRIEKLLPRIIAGGPPAALLYIDLDQFKLINDTSGHIAGDQLLSQLAGTMREHLRDGDVLARLGGDEFGVLALNVNDEKGAYLVAERLRERIDGYVFVWEQSTFTISASIGGVMLDRPDMSLKDLLAQADTACYMAKESGRNRVHFYSSGNDEVTRRHTEMEWANRLRWAVDEQRLMLMYQEVWRLPVQDGGAPYIELLLRFRDEAGQVVLPGAFLPAAERYGLMPMIDRWVIETALSNFDQLHPQGKGVGLVTINLSGASIDDESLIDLILELIERHGVAPERLCFEVTETVAIRNLAKVSPFIGRLRDAGCKIALDDFGAGMSSFGYLKNLPVDIIKIDGSFIRDLLSDAMSHAIVRAVTDIGHQRGLQVIAEWVSSEEIVASLVELGVDYAQGFSLHRPEPILLHRDLPKGS